MPVTMVGVNREACARYKQTLDDLLPAERTEAVYTNNPNDSVDLDKPMRDLVLLQAIARVNRPHVDAEGIRKRVGLIVEFVGFCAS